MLLNIVSNDKSVIGKKENRVRKNLSCRAESTFKKPYVQLIFFKFCSFLPHVVYVAYKVFPKCCPCFNFFLFERFLSKRYFINHKLYFL